ncbi:hypothetical protein, partial [Nocardia asiatica]|uniref:hypothetical protein n=1 Tax=Nocardia asiatica TaxID=209252 RepID=UPI001C3F4C15
STRQPRPQRATRHRPEPSTRQPGVVNEHEPGGVEHGRVERGGREPGERPCWPDGLTDSRRSGTRRFAGAARGLGTAVRADARRAERPEAPNPGQSDDPARTYQFSSGPDLRGAERTRWRDRPGHTCFESSRKWKRRGAEHP